jgi:hypothetical protein
MDAWMFICLGLCFRVALGSRTIVRSSFEPKRVAAQQSGATQKLAVSGVGSIA